MSLRREGLLRIAASLVALAGIGVAVAANLPAAGSLRESGALPQAADPQAASPWEAPPEWAEKKNPVPLDEKSLALGKVAYTKQCVPCHGVKGKGDGPAAVGLETSPGDLTDPKLWKQTDGAIYWKITEGRKPMPSYKKILTDEQRWHVVNYVRTLAPKPSS